MKIRFPHFGLTAGLILTLAACSSLKSWISEKLPGGGQSPPDAAVQTTATPDPQALIDAATLFRADFEDGNQLGIGSGQPGWRVEIEDDGNAMYCNQLSADWSSFLFGRDEWENYAISLRARFQSQAADQSVETYVRVNQETEGYRANIGNNRWAALGYYPPYSNLGGVRARFDSNEWFGIELRVVKDQLQYFLNGDLLMTVRDDKRTSGRAGFGAGPNTVACVDDILVWGLDDEGNPMGSSVAQVEGNPRARVYTLNEKIDNRPTIPVFYPWSGSGSGIDCGQPLHFDCDTSNTPYSLVWTGSGVAEDIASTRPRVSQVQRVRMRSDPDTLYLINEEWHYYSLAWRSLSEDSPFYLDEYFEAHIDSEYSTTKVINFTHPDWPGLLAEKAQNFKDAGFDGMMLDWWNNGAGNGRSEAVVEAARLAIAKAIREKVGDDFILMGNVNANGDDPTAPYLSGVFMELWKEPGRVYPLAINAEPDSGYTTSIEKMEVLLKYWNANLRWPKIIAFEPWKITTGDFIADRYSEQNYLYAKLFTAMAVVIPDNGYILYADNNDDWDGGDHQHAYYDFYRTDFGKPLSGMVEVAEGVAYKQFEWGVVAYNRTMAAVTVTLPDGNSFQIEPLEGLFLLGY